MTEKEYLERIKEIEKNIVSNSQKAMEELNDLLAFRPVRKDWFLARAEVALQQNQTQEVFSNLHGKVFFKMPSKIDKKILLALQKAFSKSNVLDWNRYEFYIHTLFDFKKNDLYYGAFLDRIQKAKSDFLQNDFSASIIEELAYCYYIEDNQILYLALKVLKTKLKHVWKDERLWVEQSYNMGFFYEMMQPERQTPFILLESDLNDQQDCLVMMKILNELEKKVFLVKAPDSKTKVKITTENDHEKIILAHRLEKGGSVVYQSVVLQNENDIICENRDAILRYIVQREIKQHFAVLLCSGNLCDLLEDSQWGKKFLQRLLPYQAFFLNRNMSGGWIGNYLSYCDFLYDFHTGRLLECPSSCSFSIVIPARNSVFYLRETLKTCLNQRFQGEYEIILSDNSTQGSTEIYDLYQEFNDRRIRYIRTPRDLPLTKSFEFACLQASGEFVFAIGSDDGVLPWALDVLQKVLIQYPELEFLTWERGFYAWTGFNGGQQNQFVIPRSYKKKNIKLITKDSKKALRNLIENPEFAYDLPLLYLNSGYKRKYLKKILANTGRLWDGICQDLYMGIVNLAINESYTVLEYPLTIAGMSNGSIGVRSNAPHGDLAAVQKEAGLRKKVNNVGAYAPMKMENIVPALNYDSASIYRSLVRVIARGILSSDFLNGLNWRKIYMNIAKNLSLQDLEMENKLNAFRYAATYFNPEFQEFVAKEICQQLLGPEEKVISGQNQKRLYEVGISDKGEVMLDASDFGVKDIYDAVQLFEKLTGL